MSRRLRTATRQLIARIVIAICAFDLLVAVILTTAEFVDWANGDSWMVAGDHFVGIIMVPITLAFIWPAYHFASQRHKSIPSLYLAIIPAVLLIAAMVLLNPL